MKGIETIIPSFEDYISIVFTDFESNFKICKNYADEDAVHDVRVALRRLISLASFLDSINDSSTLKSFRKRAKKYQKLFSPVRDVHVTLKFLETSKLKQFEVSDFISYLQEIRSAEEENLLQTLKETKASTLINYKEALLNSATSVSSDLQIEKRLLVVIDDAYLNLIDKLLKINPNQFETLHAVRIALKDFRYKMDIISLSNIEYQAIVNHTKKLQDNLGEIQDLRVLINYLTQFDKNSAHTSKIDPLITYLEENISSLSHAFYNQRFEIHQLWEVTT
jgi:CHAD domain-containing protein